MASITTVPQASSTTTTSTAQRNMDTGSIGGRGRGGFRGRAAYNNDTQRGGRGSGHHRGRGGRGNQADWNKSDNQRARGQSNSVIQPNPPLPPPPGLGGGGSFSVSPTKDAETVEGEGGSRREGKQQEVQGEDVEAEVCFICASAVVHNSVAPCNHRTCHICALRLRALYKTRACAHCRVSGIPKFRLQRNADSAYRQRPSLSSSRMTRKNDMKILRMLISKKRMRTLGSSTSRKTFMQILYCCSGTIAPIKAVTMLLGDGRT